MVKRQTRKARATSRKATAKGTTKMGLKKLRSSFDHMDKFVNSLKAKSKHSFSDAVSEYRAEWQRVFKREISPADAASYLKFRFGIKGKTAMTRRRKMRGGALPLPLAGAPLDYTTRAGVNGVYGNFPSYQQEGLDRYYGSALSADCGKPNGFPTDGSSAQAQVGGGVLDGFMRPIIATAPPSVTQNALMVDYKGMKPYPTADPVGNPPIRNPSMSYITNANMSSWARSYTGGTTGSGQIGDMYARSSMRS
jgi:hypothetical protein